MWSVAMVCSFLFQFSTADLYTAITDLEKLLESEALLIQTLQSNIAAEEAKLEALRSQAKNFEKIHNEATSDIPKYLSNPINAYLLIRRMTVDWRKTVLLIQENAYKNVQDLTSDKEHLTLPSDEDLLGAADALLRLQKTYKLDTSSVARGEINGVQCGSALSASDCFELGRHSYNEQDCVHTSLWMKEALKKYEQEANVTTPHKWEILEYLSYCTYVEGNVHGALQLTDELLKLFPNHEKALGNRAHYLSAIENEEESGQNSSLPEMAEVGVETGELESEDTNETKERRIERAKYESLCREEISLSPAYEAKLKCHYVSHNNPHLLIGPLKEEEAYLEPRIVLYRDVISDSEIETIKQMATPKLRRAKVVDYKSGKPATTSYRICKSTWLLERESELVKRISKRVEDMTGLTTSTAEELQVANYGIGGHFEPHFDFATPRDKGLMKSFHTGNRIATVLFYMSDVAVGGATVFPRLSLSLKPQKGTAAVWMNLHASCDGDYRTLHAACPVLIGSKWVSNKWLHERGQEFLRPCVPNEYRSEEIHY